MADWESILPPAAQLNYWIILWNELIHSINETDGIDDFYQYDEPFELDYETPGKYYYDGGSMGSLRERLNATSDDALIVLAGILPDTPADFTINSITLTLTD